MSGAENILETTKLSIGYADKKHGRRIAEHLDLKLRKGRFVCLLGPNGTGKSTLIRTLGGLQPGLNGEVLLQGKPLEDFQPQARAKLISLVLTGMLPAGIFSVYSLVALGRHPHTRWNGSLTGKDHEKINKAIQAAKAELLTNRLVGELSDGERQKVMIARALAQEAPVMLLDEPTAFLDIVRRIELMHTLRDLAHHREMAVLLSTHDLELALQNADELWLFAENGSISTGTPESLALSGELDQLFGSRELRWDAAQGNFQLKREPCVYVSLTGGGPELLWTRRTLRRLGYGISETTPANLSIQISTRNSNPVWKISSEQGVESFNSLETFTARMEKHARTGNQNISPIPL